MCAIQRLNSFITVSRWYVICGFVSCIYVECVWLLYIHSDDVSLVFISFLWADLYDASTISGGELLWFSGTDFGIGKGE